MSKPESSKRTRFAIYTRYSSEMQNDLSLEAQEERCRRAIAERGGVVVSVFSDGARSGWSLDREGFIQLCRAAERGKFDAVMFWKFDRLARNHEHAVMIKMLLRHEHGLKLYCVEGFSEDEDDSPYTAMMEQMLAVFSAFYSRNLSSETKRGKQQRVLKGEYNGSTAPFGYDLVRKGEATEEKPAGLYINPRLAAIVRRAFRMYATGDHSDNTIADWMNARKEIRKLREGKKPIGKATVRDILLNRVYTGRVSYAETLYTGSLGQGKQSNRLRRKWFEGKHRGFVSDELFATCLEVRRNHAAVRRPSSVLRTYILHDRVFCARCTTRKPTALEDDRYGKMRPSWNPKQDSGWYRCVARDRGYLRCEQSFIRVTSLDHQVVAELRNLTIPEGYRGRIEAAIRRNVENEEAYKRMAEIEEAVKRVDFSWEKGFLTPEEYLEKRNQLLREIESLRPVDYDELIEAADLLQNFTSYWAACAEVEKPAEARKQLLAKIVDRVFVYDDAVIAIALHGNYAVVLDTAGLAPDEVVEKIRSETKRGTNDSVCTPNAQSGSDGIRTRDLGLDRAAC
jgi:DNA invertase Pin-like site-specific DNA recombinase